MQIDEWDIYISCILKYDEEFGGISSLDCCMQIIREKLGYCNLKTYCDVCRELRTISKNDILLMKKLYNELNI